MRVALVLAGVVAAAGLFVLFGFVVVWLWNWLMPAIFSLPRIGFWQAWGLVVLSSILLKGHSSGSHARGDRRRKRALREHMQDLDDGRDRRGDPGSAPDAGEII
ncbi:hypothetical protein [Salinispira pacifica]